MQSNVYFLAYFLAQKIIILRGACQCISLENWGDIFADFRLNYIPFCFSFQMRSTGQNSLQFGLKETFSPFLCDVFLK